MRIGALDRQLHIRRDLGTGRNAHNEPVPQWTGIAVVWASKRTVAGTEFLAGSQTVAEERALFTIRWRPDFSANDQLECEGRTYAIEGAREIGRRQYLEIQATSVGEA